MHAFRFRRHFAFGIEIALERAPCGKVIDQFDTADFDDAMAVGRVEPGSLGIENDFTNVLQFCEPFVGRGAC